MLSQIIRLTRLCIAGPGGKIGALYFLMIFGLGLAGVQVGVRLIAWTADFYNALQKLDVDGALRQIAIFFGLNPCGALSACPGTSSAPASCAVRTPQGSTAKSTTHQIVK